MEFVDELNLRIQSLERDDRTLRREAIQRLVASLVLAGIWILLTVKWDDVSSDAILIGRFIAGLAALVAGIMTVVATLIHGSCARRLNEARALRDASSTHHQLLPEILRPLVLRGLLWRSLCRWGVILMVSLSFLTAGFFSDGARGFGNRFGLVEIILATSVPPVTVLALLAMGRLVVLGIRFLRISRRASGGQEEQQ